MSPDFVVSVARDGIMTILMVAAPILGVGLGVGLLVSVFQATTQIQEPTLAFVPKIAAVMLSLMIFGGWILQVVMSFTLDLWAGLGTLF